MQTTMSCPLPQEILDLIVDHLHNERTALKTCCLVSRSWVPQTRKHLFTHLAFDSSSQIEKWKMGFPDHSNSPALYTRTLSIHDPSVVTAANAVDGWFCTFRNIVHLQLWRLDRASLIPLYGLSPTIRSLRLTCTTANIFDLICSFPLLEDLALVDLFPCGGEDDGWNAPSTSPKLAGALGLRTPRTARFVTRQLLDLPGGLHFSKINVWFFNDGPEWIPGLVSRCSHTLEFLIIGLLWISSAFPSVPVTARYLTTARRRRNTQGGYDRPLQGHKTQTPDVSGKTSEVDRPVGHRGAPNRRLQNPSKYHH